MNISKIVGENLKNARKIKRLTQKQVAEKFFMTQQYGRFENCIFELGYQQIINICKFLEITPNELFKFDNN